MSSLITLVLILHNRHRNLDRLLDYYKNTNIPILIADSSTEKHRFADDKHPCKHLYTPNVTFTKKVELVLQKVATPYVVMCADDDFIIPAAITECVNFLEANSDYSIAQGSCIKYYMSSIGKNQIEFGLLYEPKQYDIEIEDPLERLEKMFDYYRSVLYAVHRTEILRLAFKDASTVIKNLYLNEYLTAVVPIISGKYKELPVLYQVREYAADSDDKVTDNLDTIFSAEKYKTEREGFVTLLTENATPLVDQDKEKIRATIFDVLKKFSTSPLIAKNAPKLTTKKRAGLIVKKIPLFGNWLIERNRKMERTNDLKKILKTPDDEKRLLQVEAILKKHAGFFG